MITKTQELLTGLSEGDAISISYLPYERIFFRRYNAEFDRLLYSLSKDGCWHVLHKASTYPTRVVPAADEDIFDSDVGPDVDPVYLMMSGDLGCNDYGD